MTPGDDFVATCGAECPGCACHIAPPCSHCTEHLRELSTDTPPEVLARAMGLLVTEELAMEFRAALCPVCHTVFSARDGSPIAAPPLCKNHDGFVVRTMLASTPESARGVAKFATEHFLRSYRKPAAQ